MIAFLKALRRAVRRAAPQPHPLPPPHVSTLREAEKHAQQWAYIRKLDRQT